MRADRSVGTASDSMGTCTRTQECGKLRELDGARLVDIDGGEDTLGNRDLLRGWVLASLSEAGRLREVTRLAGGFERVRHLIEGRRHLSLVELLDLAAD